MSFISAIKEKAKTLHKTIVLPEGHDIRVIEAARKITDEGFAKVILIGDRENIEKVAGNINLSDIDIISPSASEKF